MHNFLLPNTIYCAPGTKDVIKENGEIVPGSWRQDKGSVFEDLKNGSSRNISTSGKKVRDIFTEYFINEGSVEWQWGKC